VSLILLDTGVVVDIINDKRGRRRFVADLFDRGDDPVCCAVTIAEVYAGMREHDASLL